MTHPLQEGASTVLVTLAQAAEEGGATRVVLPEIDELIMGTVAFVLFFLVMARLVFPNLRRSLKAREDAIRGELERAEAARLEAEEQREEYRRRLAEAREEADRIIREASESAERLRQERTERADEEARQIVERARQDAAQERDRLLGEIRRQVADLSIEAARRVIGQELTDEAAQRRLVDDFIEQVGAAGNGRTGG